VFALVRWRRRLAFVCGSDAPLALYLAWAAREFAQVDPRDDDVKIAAIADPIERLAVGESLPDFLARAVADERGLDDARALFAAMNRRAPLTVRANRLKNARDELAARLAKEGIGSQPPSSPAPDALVLDTHKNAYGLAAFKEGRFELQDAGSQLIAEAVAPPPRGLVLDACAGAGGKTLALGALLENRGRLWACDVSPRKLDELRERARRAGLTNARAVTAGDPALAPLEGRCDRVLVDAPCSGVGVLRRNPETRWRLAPGDLDELPRVQRQILDEYARYVAPGGRLIYATCTVLAAENDALVAAFLAARADFEDVPLKEIFGSERAHAVGDGRRLRLLPHQHDTDGFYAAILRRR